MADKDRDIGALHTTMVKAFNMAMAKALSATAVEDAISQLSAAARTTLGDATAHERPGGLKPGERQFTVSGFFMLSPDGAESILVAEHGFPSNQRRLRIPADLGHPGEVVRTQRGLLLQNTDDHADFQQILSTARMGSAMYSPMIWQSRYLGQLITASQARNTYGLEDHMLHMSLALAATSLFVAADGPAFIAAL